MKTASKPHDAAVAMFGEGDSRKSAEKRLPEFLSGKVVGLVLVGDSYREVYATTHGDKTLYRVAGMLGNSDVPPVGLVRLNSGAGVAGF